MVGLYPAPTMPSAAGALQSPPPDWNQGLSTFPLNALNGVIEFSNSPVSPQHPATTDALLDGRYRLMERIGAGVHGYRAPGPG